MNKTMKIALCIGLTGLGMFVWTHFAAAKGKPARAPVVVTFLSGDVISAPQPLGGPFTATIDFARHLDYPAGGGSVDNWKEILNFFQARNPITYDSLTIQESDNPLYGRLDFKVTIDGINYTIRMNAFLAGEPNNEFTPTLYTYHWREGRFAIGNGTTKELLVETGCYGGRPNVDFSVTKVPKTSP